MKERLNGIVCSNCRANGKWHGFSSYHMENLIVDIFKSTDGYTIEYWSPDFSCEKIENIKFCPWCGHEYREEDEVPFAIPAED